MLSIMRRKRMIRIKIDKFQFVELNTDPRGKVEIHLAPFLLAALLPYVIMQKK